MEENKTMTSKEALEKLRLLAIDNESNLSNSSIAREYTNIIKHEIEMTEELFETIANKFHFEFIKRSHNLYEVFMIAYKEYQDPLYIVNSINFVVNNDGYDLIKRLIKREVI